MGLQIVLRAPDVARQDRPPPRRRGLAVVVLVRGQQHRSGQLLDLRDDELVLRQVEALRRAIDQIAQQAPPLRAAPPFEAKLETQGLLQRMAEMADQRPLDEGARQAQHQLLVARGPAHLGALFGAEDRGDIRTGVDVLCTALDFRAPRNGHLHQEEAVEGAGLDLDGRAVPQAAERDVAEWRVVHARIEAIRAAHQRQAVRFHDPPDHGADFIEVGGGEQQPFRRARKRIEGGRQPSRTLRCGQWGRCVQHGLCLLGWGRVSRRSWQLHLRADPARGRRHDLQDPYQDA